MNADYTKDGCLSFKLRDLLDDMPAERKVELAQELSCDDAIIKHVADQIIDGFTEDLSSGARACTASPEPWCALDDAIRRVAKSSGDIAKSEIERLETALRESNAELQRMREEEVRRRRSYAV